MKTNSSETDLAVMRQELDLLKAKVAALANNRELDPVLENSPVTDRRGMMKKMAGLAAGLAAAGLLRPNSSKAGSRTPNATGGNMILGTTNDADAPTKLKNSTTALIGSSFTTENYGNVNFAQPANTNIGMVGYVNTAGAAGTTSNDLIGIYGQALGGGSATGIFGTGTDVGVEGDGVVGVLGNGSGSGCGVDGNSNGASTLAFGVRGFAATGAGGFFTGGRAAIGTGIGNGAVANPNVTNPSGGSIGDFYRGSTAGGLWYRAAGAAGSYRRLADSTTAGALTVFPNVALPGYKEYRGAYRGWRGGA